MAYLFITFTLLFLKIHSQSYQVVVSCGQCTSVPTCNQCITYNGGPFQNFQTCVDTVGCSFLSSTSETVEFSCLNPDGTCTYKQSITTQSLSGTTSQSDPNWAQIALGLNSLLQIQQNSTTLPSYNWCTGVGTCSGLPPGAIAGIVIGSVVGAVVVVFVVLCLCKRKRQQKSNTIEITLNSNTNDSKMLYSDRTQGKSTARN